jgi:ribosomal protein S18 acetylase RimI-like enzyme
VNVERLTIRQLTEGDAEAYRALRLHLLRVSPDSYGTTYEEAVARPIEHTALRLREPSDPEVGFTLGAFVPELVGMVTVLRGEGAKSRHKAHICAMGVASSARERGIGRALMTEALARARQIAGLEQVLLTVVLPNEAALRLYRGLGFVSYGTDWRGLKLGDQYWNEEQLILEL